MVRVGQVRKESLDTLKKALRGEMNSQELIDQREQEGQKMVNSEIMLSREMNPSKEVWEKLGFVFYEIPGNKVLYKAELPKGWKLVPNEHPMWSNLIDEFGNLRGQMFYKSSYTIDISNMELFKKYGIRRKNISDDPIIDEYYFGNPKEVLFVGGRTTLPLNATDEQREEYFKQESEIRAKLLEFADENYPGWDDPCAYWDKTPTESKGIQK